jgi:hypothetical protein
MGAALAADVVELACVDVDGCGDREHPYKDGVAEIRSPLTMATGRLRKFVFLVCHMTSRRPLLDRRAMLSQFERLQSHILNGASLNEAQTQSLLLSDLKAVDRPDLSSSDSPRCSYHKFHRSLNLSSCEDRYRIDALR